MKRIAGIILIAGALILGYIGIDGLNENSSAVRFLGIKIKSEDKTSKEIAYIEIGIALIALGGGVILASQKKR